MAPRGSRTVLMQEASRVDVERTSDAADDRGAQPTPAATGDLVTALSALLVDPSLGGVILIGAPGTGKSAWLEATARRAGMLSLHVTHLVPGMTEDRLYGGLDLARTMRYHSLQYADGLLQRADGGLVVTHALGRLPIWALYGLGTALRHGEMRVERDGASHYFTTRFALLGAVLPDESLPCALTDGIAFQLELVAECQGGEDGRCATQRLSAQSSVPSSDLEVVERLAARLPDPSALQAARAHLPRVKVGREVIEAICRHAVTWGGVGHRGEWLALRAAVARAALHSRQHVEAGDLDWALTMVLGPRRRQGRDGQGDAGDDRTAQHGTGGRDPERSTIGPRRGRDRGGQPNERYEDASEPLPGRKRRRGENRNREPSLQQNQSEAERAGAYEPLPTPTLPPSGQGRRLLDRLSKLRERAAFTSPSYSVQRRSLRNAAEYTTLSSRVKDVSRSLNGAYQGTGPGDPRQQPLALAATLRAAIPLQPVRQRKTAAWCSDRTSAEVDAPVPPACMPTFNEAHPQFLLRSEDLRVRRHKPRMGTLFVVAVDASGSVGRRRLAQAKGLALHLVESVYVNRDRVAIIVFQGEEARLLVPPARSRLPLVRARIDEVGTGGGTPLAAALTLGYQLWERERRRSTVELVLLTDGRANVTHDADRDRNLREDSAHWCAALRGAPGLQSIVIDTSSSSSHRSVSEAKTWSEQLGGTYIWMPHADERELADVVAGKRR